MTAFNSNYRQLELPEYDPSRRERNYLLHSSTTVLALRHCWRIGVRALPLLTGPCVQEEACIISSHPPTSSLRCVVRAANAVHMCRVPLQLLTFLPSQLPYLLYMIPSFRLEVVPIAWRRVWVQSYKPLRTSGMQTSKTRGMLRWSTHLSLKR